MSMVTATKEQQTTIEEIRKVLVLMEMPIEVRKKKILAIVGTSLEFGKLPKETIVEGDNGKPLHTYKTGDTVEGRIRVNMYTSKTELYTSEYTFRLDMTYLLDKGYANSASLRRAGKRELDKLSEEFATDDIYNNRFEVVDKNWHRLKYACITDEEKLKQFVLTLYGRG